VEPELDRDRTLFFFVSGKSPRTMPGGLGAYAYNTSRIVRDLGFRIRMIGFSDREERTQMDGLDLIHVTSPFSRLVGLGAFLLVPTFVRALRGIIEQEKPERVVVMSAGIWGAVGVELQRQLAGRLRVDTLVAYFTTYRHEYAGHLQGAPASDYGARRHLLIRGLELVSRRFLSPREHRMLRASGRVIVHYQSTRNLLLGEIAGLDPAKVKTIPYYVEHFERQSAAEFAGRGASDAPHVVVLCRQDPRKGINTFLKAAKLLRERGVRFACTVAGSGIFLEANRQLARKLGLAEQVRFPGFVPSTEAVLDSADIYVLPSVEEGSGAISLLEAMKKGVAIVTTLCDGIPEDFVSGETGLLVPPGDSAAMADALQSLIADPARRDRMARAVRADYARRFTFEKMRDGIVEVLEAL